MIERERKSDLIKNNLLVLHTINIMTSGCHYSKLEKFEVRE